MDKIKGLERETAELRTGNNVVEAITSSNRELAKHWSNTNKRERVEKDTPDDHTLEDFLSEGQETMEDNHKTFAWEIRRIIKQPNKEPSAYWTEAKYKTEIRPNLKEALYLSHLIPMTISPKAMNWGHNLKVTVAVKYYTHAQSSANISLEHDSESLETRTVSVSQDRIKTFTNPFAFF